MVNLQQTIEGNAENCGGIQSTAGGNSVLFVAIVCKILIESETASVVVKFWQRNLRCDKSAAKVRLQALFRV